MNILVAMNSFKGCFSALEASTIVEKSIKEVSSSINTDIIPLVDGGTGSLEAWAHILKLKPLEVATVDALNRPVIGEILSSNDIAYIEMASASGLHLLEEQEHNICKATTYGTGILIKEAMSLGCKHIYLGLGGSATHDLGTGILRALGVKFYDKAGTELITPQELENLSSVDDNALLTIKDQIEFTLLCDVNNPLLGKNGAASVFAPQKGAITEELLEQCEKLSKVFVDYYAGQEIEIGNIAGDGAAGGIPALLRTLLKANVESGVEFTARISQLYQKIRNVDIVITGEGQFDEQSFYGKGPGEIIEISKTYHKPIIILTGGYRNIPNNIDHCSIFAISPHPATLKESIKNADKWLGDTTFNAVKLFSNGLSSKRSS